MALSRIAPLWTDVDKSVACVADLFTRTGPDMAISDPKLHKLALPDHLRRQLILLAVVTGESPSDILADAVALHLDALGELIDEHLPDAPQDSEPGEPSSSAGDRAGPGSRLLLESIEALP